MRGCEFEVRDRAWVPVGTNINENFSELALYDVAMALGFDGENQYNSACETMPDLVRARLAAL